MVKTCHTVSKKYPGLSFGIGGIAQQRSGIVLKAATVMHLVFTLGEMDVSHAVGENTEMGKKQVF